MRVSCFGSLLVERCDSGCVGGVAIKYLRQPVTSGLSSSVDVVLFRNEMD